MRSNLSQEIIALGLAAAVLFTAAGCATAGPRPVLQVWSAESDSAGHSRSPMCDRFWRDHRTDLDFRAALASRYDVQYCNADRRWLEAKLNGITSVPTFVTPSGRIVAYTTPEDLLCRLGIVCPVPRPPAAPQVTGPRPQTPPATPDVSKIEERIGELQQRQEQRLQQIERTVTERDPAERIAGVEDLVRNQQTTIDETLRRSEETATHVQTLRERIEERLKGLGTTAIEQTGHGGWWAIAGFAAQALGFSTPPVFLALLAARSVLRWRRRRKQQRSHTPTGPTDADAQKESPSATVAVSLGCKGCELLRREKKTLIDDYQRLQQQAGAEIESLREQLVVSEEARAAGVVTKTRTEYVTVPTSDGEAEALKEAMRREASVNPDVASALNRVEEVAREIARGQRVKQKWQSSPREPKPGD